MCFPPAVVMLRTLNVSHQVHHNLKRPSQDRLVEGDFKQENFERLNIYVSVFFIMVSNSSFWVEIIIFLSLKIFIKSNHSIHLN